MNKDMMQSPVSSLEANKIKLVKGPNVKSIPELKHISKNIELTILLKMGDNISTDEILPAGARVLPFRGRI